MNTTVMQATDRPAVGLLRTVLGSSSCASA